MGACVRECMRVKKNASIEMLKLNVETVAIVIAQGIEETEGIEDTEEIQGTEQRMIEARERVVVNVCE